MTVMNIKLQQLKPLLLAGLLGSAGEAIFALDDLNRARPLLSRHRYGSPALGNLTSDTCHPCYPDGSLVRLPLPAHQHCGLPYTGTRSATAFSLRGYFWVHSSLRPTSLSFRNLRPSIARTPLLRATKAHGQLLGRDFNPLAKLLLLRTPSPFYPLLGPGSI